MFIVDIFTYFAEYGFNFIIKSHLNNKTSHLKNNTMAMCKNKSASCVLNLPI